jgi:transcription antitermination factor NusG
LQRGRCRLASAVHMPLRTRKRTITFTGEPQVACFQTKRTLLIKDGEALSCLHENSLESSAAAFPAAAAAPSSEWFAVYVNARHEKAVCELFRQRQIEGFLPLYNTLRRWKNGCQVQLELPLFPCYLFAHIDLRERVRVLQVPGVIAIVGCGREPARIPAAIIESLRAAVVSGHIQPHEYLAAGYRVRIKAGPMAGIEGVLIRRKSNLRVVLSVDHIMQSASVEVEISEIEPASDMRATA